jgi:hypothetical protein
MEALTNNPTNENHETGCFGQKLEEKNQAKDPHYWVEPPLQRPADHLRP